MDVFRAIKSRRSVREFKDDPIPFPIISKILEVIKWVPCAANLHTTRVVFINEPKDVHKIANACIDQEWVQEAPVIVVMCSETPKLEAVFGEKGKQYALQSTAAATQNILLTAEELGIAGCWIGAFSDNQVRKVLKIPQSVEIHNLIALGYPKRKVKTPVKPDSKALAKFNAWSVPFDDVHDLGTLWVKGIRGLKRKTKQIKEKRAAKKAARAKPRTTKAKTSKTSKKK